MCFGVVEDLGVLQFCVRDVERRRVQPEDEFEEVSELDEKVLHTIEQRLGDKTEQRVQEDKDGEF